MLARALAELDKKTLKPIFTTDFVRERAEIAWGRGKTKVVIEAALDLGHVVVGKQKEEICELELELREGEPAALLELAAELAATLALMPCDISKAERGYRLYDANSYSLSLPAPQLTPKRRWTTPSPRWLAPAGQQPAPGRAISLQWPLAPAAGLGRKPRRIARPAQQPRPGRAASIHPRPARRTRCPAGRLAPAGSGRHDDEDVRKAAPEQFLEELEDPRWGLFSLNTSRWLLARTWTAERNTRGNRQGAAQLASWLPRLLGEEATPCNCSATSSNRKTWPSNCRASSASRPGCTTRATCWTSGNGSPVRRAEQAGATGQRADHRRTLDARKQQAIAVYQNRAWKMLLRCNTAIAAGSSHTATCGSCLPRITAHSDRQAGGGLDLRQRHNRVDLLNPRHQRQLLEEEPLIRLDVRRDDPQQKSTAPSAHNTPALPESRESPR
jgi:hypothetical protein